MAKKRWSDLSSQQKSGVIALVAIQAVLAGVAQRDLSSRAASEVRGPKALWRVLTLNSIGAIAYLLVGRVARASA